MSHSFGIECRLKASSGALSTSPANVYLTDVADGRVHVRHSKAVAAELSRSRPMAAEFFEQVAAGRAGDAPGFIRYSGEELTDAGLALDAAMLRV